MFTCVNCGSSYQQRLAWCWSCMSTGSLIVAPVRPRSSLQGTLQKCSAKDLASRSWNLFVPDDYPSIRLMKGCLALLVGGPGHGKSTMCLRLLDSLKGSVALLSIEEKFSPSISERLQRLNVRRDDFHLFTGGVLDDLVSSLKMLKVKALGVDSINVVQLLPAELRKIQIAANVPLLICAQQVVKDGGGAGSNQWPHEADVIIRIENMKWKLVKSRYQDVGIEGYVLKKEVKHES